MMKNNTKNQKYWEDRIILKDKLLEKDIKKIEKKLLKLFKTTRKEVLNELKIIYYDIESTEYAKYRIDSLLTSINMALDNLYNKNEEMLTKAFIDLYTKFDNEASIDLGVSFNVINENLIKETVQTNWGTRLNNKKDVFTTHGEVLEKIVDDLINSNWSGLSLVERIQEHKRKLSLTLKEELTKGFIRGDSLQDISRVLSDKMDLSYKNSLRLVRTESCFIMNEATINNYKNNDIKEYQIMAFLDNKTSKICREKDGEVVNVKDAVAGKNMPPFH